MPSVLIVDDDAPIREMIAAVLEPAGYDLASASDGHEALARYKSGTFDVVVTDLLMRQMDGLTLLRQLKLFDPTAVIVIMTAHATLETSMEAIKHGAFDYLQKPFRVQALLDTLHRAVELKQYQRARSQPGSAALGTPVEVESRLIGQSPSVKKLVAYVKKLTAHSTPVLLIGESGTGKSLVTDVLHLASGGTDANFVPVDCSFSSEARFREGLLGHEGQGGPWVHKAKGGTLLIENLECLAGPAQKELTSVLRNTAHGFRLVCTTSEDIEKLVDEGRFYAELFYRVGSLPIQLLPLRERAEDIPLLVKHALGKVVNPLLDAKGIEFAPDAMAALQAYQWPGNLTELFQVIAKVAVTTETRVITLAQLPPRLR